MGMYQFKYEIFEDLYILFEFDLEKFDELKMSFYGIYFEIEDDMKKDILKQLSEVYNKFNGDDELESEFFDVLEYVIYKLDFKEEKKLPISFFFQIYYYDEYGDNYLTEEYFEDNLVEYKTFINYDILEKIYFEIVDGYDDDNFITLKNFLKSEENLPSTFKNFETYKPNFNYIVKKFKVNDFEYNYDELTPYFYIDKNDGKINIF